MILKRHSVPILTMSQYTPKERAEIVAFCIENNRSIVKTVRVYRIAGQCYAECAKKSCFLCTEWRWSFNRRYVLKLI